MSELWKKGKCLDLKLESMGKLEVCEVCLGVEQVSICEFGVHNVIDQLGEQFAQKIILTHKNVGITCFFYKQTSHNW